MKGGQNFRDLQAKKEKAVEERWLPQLFCMVCTKEIEGYYARYGNTGVCGRACMTHQETLDRFPGHSAEDFERTL